MNRLLRVLEINSNYTLHYLQNILPYIIIECKMHYVYLEPKKKKKRKKKTNKM